MEGMFYCLRLAGNDVFVRIFKKFDNGIHAWIDDEYDEYQLINPTEEIPKSFKIFIEALCGVCEDPFEFLANETGENYPTNCEDCRTPVHNDGRFIPSKSYVVEFDKVGFIIINPEEFVTTETPLRFKCKKHKHIRPRTIKALLKTPWCDICADVKFIKPDFPTNTDRRTNKREQLDNRRDAAIEAGFRAANVTEEDRVLSIFDETAHIFIRFEERGKKADLVRITYKCADRGHVMRVSSTDVEEPDSFNCEWCPKMHIPSKDRMSKEAADAELKRLDLVRSSKYLNKSVILELCCNICQHVCYKTMGSLESKTRKSRCEYCYKHGVIQANREINRITSCKEFRVALVLAGYTFECNEPSSNECATTLIDTICPAGHMYSTNKTRFIDSGNRCDVCNNGKRSARLRLPLPDAHAIATNAGLILLTEDYRNMKEMIMFRCAKTYCNVEFDAALERIKYCGGGCPSCNASAGERLVQTYLQSLSTVEFKIQCKFPGKCRDKNDLLFDFQVFIKGTNNRFLIEVDGQQHFGPVKIFKGEPGFINTRRRDKIKTYFCMKERIPLLRVSYKEIYNGKVIGLIDNMIECLSGNQPKGNIFVLSNKKVYEQFLEDFRIYWNEAKQTVIKSV
jgi:hypothetical protein